MRPEQLPGDLGGMNRLSAAGVVEFRAAAAEVGSPVCHLPDSESCLQFNPEKI
jgi:hypothetical protein